MRDESWHDTAQICLNGHLITDIAQSAPELRKPYCDRCGDQTITACLSCQALIRGHYHVPGVVSFSHRDAPPRYCHECGEPYPWTERSLKAARELTDELDALTSDERAQLKGSLDDLVRETARTQVATLRFKRLVAKAGSGVVDMFKEILVAVVSESVRRALWGV
jgi:hypothetical protein